MTNLITPIQEILEETSLSPGDIDKVILAGGSSKIPKLAKSISGILKEAEILNTLSPDEVIALGAAEQATLLEDKWSGGTREELKGG